MTWQEYEEGLKERLADLKDRIHRGAYRARPSRRIYIPKPDGRQRPIGIAALEDKIVQQAVVTILNQMYEVDFPMSVIESLERLERVRSRGRFWVVCCGVGSHTAPAGDTLGTGTTRRKDGQPSSHCFASRAARAPAPVLAKGSGLEPPAGAEPRALEPIERRGRPAAVSSWQDQPASE